MDWKYVNGVYNLMVGKHVLATIKDNSVLVMMGEFIHMPGFKTFEEAKSWVENEFCIK